MDNILPEQLWLTAHIQIQWRLHQMVVLFLSIIVTATAAVVQLLEHPGREPYHTSILTGEGWVMELLGGHPDCICCELGMSLDSNLISDLQAMGHANSKHVSLEEQLVIFLYAIVTGLTVRHLGERFQ